MTKPKRDPNTKWQQLLREAHQKAAVDIMRATLDAANGKLVDAAAALGISSGYCQIIVQRIGLTVYARELRAARTEAPALFDPLSSAVPLQSQEPTLMLAGPPDDEMSYDEILDALDPPGDDGGGGGGSSTDDTTPTDSMPDFEIPDFDSPVLDGNDKDEIAPTDDDSAPADDPVGGGRAVDDDAEDEPLDGDVDTGNENE
jgi:hypothetical protein